MQLTQTSAVQLTQTSAVQTQEVRGAIHTRRPSLVFSDVSRRRHLHASTGATDFGKPEIVGEVLYTTFDWSNGVSQNHAITHTLRQQVRTKKHLLFDQFFDADFALNSYNDRDK